MSETRTILEFPTVVADTATMSRDEWLRARHMGIGGSDTGAILGVSPWESRYTLWKEKTSPQPDQSPPTDAMADGNLMEPVIAEIFAEQSGMVVLEDTNLYAHPEALAAAPHLYLHAASLSISHPRSGGPRWPVADGRAKLGPHTRSASGVWRRKSRLHPRLGGGGLPKRLLRG